MQQEKQETETIQLEDLVGKHVLTGVDFEPSQTSDTCAYLRRDCQVINFVLDDKTYTATEDPDDGYRSCMEDIKKSDATVKNVFKSCRVVGKMRGGSDDVIDFTDSVTNKIVLSIGTENTDDYYPCFVAEFTPENMTVNQKTANRKHRTSRFDPSPRQGRKRLASPTSTPTVRRKRQLP